MTNSRLVPRPAPKPAAPRKVRRPTQAPPPPQPPNAKKTVGGVNPLHLIVVGVVALALIILAINEVLIKPSAIKPDHIVVGVVRDSNKEPYRINAEDLLGPTSQHLRECMDIGKGIMVAFTTKGVGGGDKYEVLAPSPTSDPDANTRAAEIEDAKKKFGQYLARINNPPARWKKFIILADNTTGDKSLAERVTARYNTLGIDKVLLEGHGVTVRFHRLTGQPFFEGTEPIVIDPKSSTGTKQEEIKGKMEVVFKATEDKSAIATGTANALTEDFSVDPSDGDTRIFLFSDLCENFEGTLSVESGPLSNLTKLREELADPEKRKAFKDRLMAIKKLPPLNGATVDIYFPPDSARLPRMLVLFKVWEEILTENGASKVIQHF